MSIKIKIYLTLAALLALAGVNFGLGAHFSTLNGQAADQAALTGRITGLTSSLALSLQTEAIDTPSSAARLDQVSGLLTSVAAGSGPPLDTTGLEKAVAATRAGLTGGDDGTAAEGLQRMVTAAVALHQDSLAGLKRTNRLRDAVLAPLVLVMIGVVILAVFHLYRTITRPLTGLVDRAEKISSDQGRIPGDKQGPQGRDELSRLDRAFDAMTTKLLSNIGRLEREVELRRATEEGLKASEAKFRQLVESTPVPMAIILGSRYLFTNRAWTRLTGYRAGAPDPENPLAIFHPQDRRRVAEMAEAVLEGSLPEGSASTSITTRAGEVRWLDVSIAKLNWEGDPATLLAGVDITTNRKAQQSLKESEARYRAQYEAYPHPIYTWQRSGGEFFLREANRAAHEFVGPVLSEQHIGRPASELLADRPELIHRMSLAWRGKTSVRREMVYTNPDLNRTFHLDITHAFAPPDLVLSYNEDVGERKDLESRLRQAAKMEAIGTLAGGIAHDFNNILSAVLGYTELAMSDLPPGAPAMDSLNRVMTSAHRAKKLVAQILSFSRRAESTPRPVRLADTVAEALTMVRSTTPSTVDIASEIRTETSTVSADPTQIHQVVINLCTNAAQALGNRGGRIELSLDRTRLLAPRVVRDTVLPPGRYLRLKIGDNGPGMKEEVVERIFEPFFTTKQTGRGTGLGLAVVHGIVAEHDGAIDVESSPGQGTTFTIHLPLASGGLAHKSEPAPDHQ